MERITTRVKDGDFEMVEVGTSDDYIKAVDMLADYEDTGITPPEIMELAERDTAMEINEIHVDEYYCPACGAENNCDQGVVEDYFCPRCGQRLKEREN